MVREYRKTSFEICEMVNRCLKNIYAKTNNKYVFAFYF